MVKTSKITLIALTSIWMCGLNWATNRLDPQLSGVPGFFLREAGEDGYVAHMPGMQVVLNQSGVRINSAAGPIDLRFPGANLRPIIDGCEQAPGRINVLHGYAKTWRTDLVPLSCVRYHELYPGIDMIYRLQGTRLKSEFIVAAGANPASIRLNYSPIRKIDG